MNLILSKTSFQSNEKHCNHTKKHTCKHE